MKKILAILLVFVLSFSLLITAFADDDTNSMPPKQEVIYVNLDNGGSVQEVSVVNIVSPDANGKIIDYGNYSSVRNMTSKDTINYDGDKIEIATNNEKLYYQGVSNNKIIPWNIDIRYLLDGKEINSEDLAGANGNLKISMKINKNSSCNSFFYENLAIQAVILLNTELCENISCEGATVANVGKNKQLTYLILPNSTSNIEIKADVHDFEMESISINGLSFSMSIDKQTISTDDFKESFNDLTEAVVKLDEAADVFVDAGNELQTGITDLLDGANKVSDAAFEAYKGSTAVLEGAHSIDLNSETLKDASKTMFDKYVNMLQLNSLASNIQYTFDIETFLDVDKNGYDGIAALKEIEEPLKQIIDNSVFLTNSVNDYAEILSYFSGVYEYSSGVNELTKGVQELNSGMQELYEGSIDLNNGVTEFKDASDTIVDGFDQLKKGTSEFRINTDGISDNVSERINVLLDDVFGEQEEVVSFADERNNNVDSVQFVIKTPSIFVEQQEIVQEEPEELNFWQKLLKLFGFVL